MTQTNITWEEEISVKEMLPLCQPVGLGGAFFFLLMINVGKCQVAADVPGFVRKTKESKPWEVNQQAPFFCHS